MSRRTLISVVLLVCAALAVTSLVPPAPLAAQHVSHVRAGVHGSGADRMRVELRSASQQPPSARQVPNAMRVRDDDDSWFGEAVLGAVIGGVIGYAVSSATCDSCDDAAPVYTLTALSAGVGALVGILLAARR